MCQIESVAFGINQCHHSSACLLTLYVKKEEHTKKHYSNLEKTDTYSVWWLHLAAHAAVYSLGNTFQLC